MNQEWALARRLARSGKDPTAMRIAQVMAGAPAGGAELFFERLTVGLANAGETVLPVIRRNPARAARLTAAGLDVVQLSFGGPFDLLTGPQVRRALGRFAPRITVAWMNRAARFTPQGDWVLAGRLGGYYDLSYYRRCDHLIGNTRGIVDWIIRQGWQAERVHHLPNFSPDMAGAVPLSLGLPSGTRIVLALGRLHRNKGFDVLIRALADLPRVHLAIAGEGLERAALLELGRCQGVADRLHLLGWRSDTASLLAAADLLVCPSRLEPLGNVVIEAWSARRAVVAAEADGPRELIASGRDGILVPLEDPTALAHAILSLLNDPVRAAALAEAGRIRYEKEHAEAPVVARWRQFLATVEKP
jgi:glycosyltransferase involved in cell wall biosynthesis